MAEANEVVEAAQRLNAQKDEAALELLLGMRAAAVEADRSLSDDLSLDLKYDSQTMGALDDVKRLGARVLKRWNKELYAVVCGNGGQDTKERKQLLDSLNLGEAAVISAVAGILLSFGIAGVIVAPLAPLIVRKFIWPAKDELCTAWGEATADQS